MERDVRLSETPAPRMKHGHATEPKLIIDRVVPVSIFVLGWADNRSAIVLRDEAERDEEEPGSDR
jgi:hypothetical protein